MWNRYIITTCLIVIYYCYNYYYIYQIFIIFNAHLYIYKFFYVSEIPDILNPTQCEMLRNWNGELRYMTNFKFRRFGKRHLNEALKRANKESKENKDIQTKVSKKLQNSSEEVKLEDIENSLNKSIDSSENNQLIECIMEIE